MATKDVLGRIGENAAAEHLEAAGYRVVERNWRCRIGEVDLIVARGDVLAFVEVKTRSSTAYGHPLEAITAQKAARLRQLVGQWCAEHGSSASTVRIDAVAVLTDDGHPLTIEHREGVV